MCINLPENSEDMNRILLHFIIARRCRYLIALCVSLTPFAGNSLHAILLFCVHTRKPFEMEHCGFFFECSLTVIRLCGRRRRRRRHCAN